MKSTIERSDIEQLVQTTLSRLQPLYRARARAVLRSIAGPFSTISFRLTDGVWRPASPVLVSYASQALPPFTDVPLALPVREPLRMDEASDNIGLAGFSLGSFPLHQELDH